MQKKSVDPLKLLEKIETNVKKQQRRDQENRFKKYGITEKQYKRMLKKQDGLCAICGTPATELTRNMSVDHCHFTGEVRGLLCNPCNLLLGNARDSALVLLKAVKYLKNPEIKAVEEILLYYSRNGIKRTPTSEPRL